ncbi:MAG: DUF3307 domain-containing protein [Bacteroidetes bacterium]|nr:DUF3307 domain-containing protein [Bacteroidota bacterium]
MISFFSYEEGSILVRLLIAHCLTDFLLQPGHWVESKRKNIWKSKYLWYHGLLTGIVAWLLLWDFSDWWLVVVITTSHICIDGLKIQIGKKINTKKDHELLLFTIDQLLHIIVIVLLWMQLINGWNKINSLIHHYLPDYRILLILLGYVIVTNPVGFFIYFITKRWTSDLNLEDSLKDAGRWIGILERILIITFIFINQYAGIGFLITAKSLLRLIDRPESILGFQKPFSARKHTEYVLIGTFLSYALAIITGLSINWLLHFNPQK